MHVHSIGTPTQTHLSGLLLQLFTDRKALSCTASLNLRKLSLHCNKHIGNLISVLNLQNLDVLDHLVDLLLGDRFLLSGRCS